MDTSPDTPDNQEYAAQLKRAFRAIQKLQQQLTASEAKQHEAIAIIGMACRFPGADTPEAFWQLLASGSEAIRAVPPERWDRAAYYDPRPATPGKMITQAGGFLDQVDQFDAPFFNISPAEAQTLDPQQRLLLEVSWEALEHANLAPDRLPHATGIFAGIGSTDYAQLLQAAIIGEEASDIVTNFGTMPSTASGRLAHFLNVQGPTYTIDTACSSALVAVHLAVQSLRSGECSLALVGAVNCVLDPEGSVGASQAGLLSPDGRCKTFDVSADGYGRGEGCGVLVLKRLADAERDGDTIVAVVKGSAANHNGQTNGLTAPNGLAQQAVIQQALRNAGLPADAIGYVEAHGTGTPLGDVIEVNALGQVFATRDAPLYLGTAKTNMGHLEWASGMVGLFKLALALQHGVIPPHLHVQTPNPNIAWDDLPFVVTRQTTPWPAGKAGGVSAFGLNGANAHVILAAAPQPAEPAQEQSLLPALLVLSARDESALRDLAVRYQNVLLTQPDRSLAAIAYTASTARAHFAQRLALVAASPAEAAQQLGAWVAGDPSAVLAGSASQIARHKVAFLFSGQDSLYAGMGQQLYATQPTFQVALDECAAKLQPHLDLPLLEILFTPTAPNRIHQPRYAQPALCAFAYALAQLWQSWGINPACVLGQDSAAYAAACVAGVCTLDAALTLAVARGQLREALPAPDAMDTFDRIARNITYHAPRISLVSSVSGQIAGPEVPTPDYWMQQAQPSDTLATGMATLQQQGITTYIVIGEYGETLYGATLECGSHAAALWLPSLQREQDETAYLLTSLGRGYVAGLPIDWQQVYQHHPRSRVPLPTYPFQRQRYWLPARPGAHGPEQPAAPASNGRTEQAELPTERAVDHLLHLDAPTRRPWLSDVLRRYLARELDCAPDMLTDTAHMLELGVDSLMVIKLLQYCNTILDLHLYPTEFYQYPRFGDFVAYVLRTCTRRHTQHPGESEQPNAAMPAVAQERSYALPNEPAGNVETTAIAAPVYPDAADIPLREYFIPQGSMQVCVWEWGHPDAPPIVLIHGIMDQAIIWEATAHELVRAGLRVIAPELRGHGYSSHMPAGCSYTLIDFAVDVDVVIRTVLGQDEPVDLAGISMGASVVALYAHARPERIRNLLLVEGLILEGLNALNPTSDTATPNQNRLLLEYLTSTIQNPILPDAQAGAARLQQWMGPLSPEWALRMAQRGLEPVNGGLRWRWDAGLQTRSVLETSSVGRERLRTIAADLHAWQVPTTLIDGRDSQFAYEQPDHLFNAVFTITPQIMIPGGHNLVFDSPRELANAMIQVLRGDSLAASLRP